MHPVTPLGAALAVALTLHAASLASAATPATPTPTSPSVEPAADAVALPKFVVKDSQSEAYYLRATVGQPTRIFFVSLDRPGLSRLPDDTRHLKLNGYLTAYRSHDLRPGDELLAIAGQPVAQMTFLEWSRALRSTSEQPPVLVTVRARDAKDTRQAAVVPHNSVTLGAKVLPAAKVPAPPTP